MIDTDDIAKSYADYINRVHDDYLEERAKLIDGERESSRSFEKYLITLSSGALGLSIAFIEKVVAKPVNVYLMCVAWAAFASALCCMLIAFSFSQKAYKEQRNILDLAHKKQGEPNAENKAAGISQRLSNSALILFCVGVFFLVAFSTTNIYFKEKKKIVNAKQNSQNLYLFSNGGKSLSSNSPKPIVPPHYPKPTRVRDAPPPSPPVPRPQPAQPKPPTK